MSISVTDGSSWRNVPNKADGGDVFIRDPADGQWKSSDEVFAKKAGAWEKIWPE